MRNNPPRQASFVLAVIVAAVLYAVIYSDDLAFSAFSGLLGLLLTWAVYRHVAALFARDLRALERYLRSPRRTFLRESLVRIAVGFRTFVRTFLPYLGRYLLLLIAQSGFFLGLWSIYAAFLDLCWKEGLIACLPRTLGRALLYSENIFMWLNSEESAPLFYLFPVIILILISRDFDPNLPRDFDYPWWEHASPHSRMLEYAVFVPAASILWLWLRLLWPASPRVWSWFVASSRISGSSLVEALIWVLHLGFVVALLLPAVLIAYDARFYAVLLVWLWLAHTLYRYVHR